MQWPTAVWLHGNDSSRMRKADGLHSGLAPGGCCPNSRLRSAGFFSVHGHEEITCAPTCFLYHMEEHLRLVGVLWQVPGETPKPPKSLTPRRRACRQFRGSSNQQGSHRDPTKTLWIQGPGRLGSGEVQVLRYTQTPKVCRIIALNPL